METSSPQQLVCQALQYACNQDLILVKQAEQKLSEWEIEPGFYSTLLSIFTNQQIDVNIRWMAAIYFKNSILKYWRKNAKYELQQSEKDQIRAQLISNFHEPAPQVAAQIAVSIAKIARFDCPKEWPELIPVLLEGAKSTDSLQQHRILLTLHQVIKALSSKRMPSERKIFEQLTQNVYSFILNLWDGFTTLFFESVQNNQEQQNQYELSINYLEKAILSLRMLRKLTLYGVLKPIASQDCMLFVNEIFRRLKECLQLRYELKLIQKQQNQQQQQQININQLIDLLEKFILKKMKLLNEYLQKHPISFYKFFLIALEFSFNYVFHHGFNLIYESNEICFQNFIIHCINLMKGILTSVAFKCLKYYRYNPPINPDNNTMDSDGNTFDISRIMNDNDDEEKAENIINKFFTTERISYICEKIITHYFLLTQNDLESWIDDPESFVSDEGGESWKYALRPCTETFFVTLFKTFKKEMSNEIIKYVGKAQEMNLTPDADLKDILLKDAIYTAIGLLAIQFHEDEIQFDSWFTHQLLNELKIKTDNFRIIRRRAIWLIGEWFSKGYVSHLAPKVYEISLELLRPEEDMAVRLAASKSLINYMLNFEFELDVFRPYLEPSFASLFYLLKDVKECETKMKVLCLMSSFVDRMDNNIHLHTENLITYLPLLWKESEDHNMLRCAIISTLVQIVKAVSDVPPTLLSFLYSVIELSTNIKNSSSVYLMEEGLELWLAVVYNSTALTAELLDLANNLIPIIEMSSENLRTVLYIIEAYIILNPDIYLQRYGKNVISTCAYLMTDMRQEGMIIVLKLFITYLNVIPNLGVELLKPVLPYIFKQIYQNNESQMVMTAFLVVVARVLIINQNIFIETLQETNLERSLETILDVWISKMLSISKAEEIKILSVALGSILTVNNPILHERFPLILQCISETLNEIMADEQYESGEDSSFMEENYYYARHIRSDYHFERIRCLFQKDPVHKIVLRDYIQGQLSTLKENLGEERFRSLMSTVDRDVLTNLSVYMNIFIEIPKPETIETKALELMEKINLK